MYKLEVDKNIAKRMMLAKVENELTYDDLKILLQIEKTCLVRRFKGKVRFTAEEIASFCEHTGVSTEWVLFGTGNMVK